MDDRTRLTNVGRRSDTAAGNYYKPIKNRTMRTYFAQVETRYRAIKECPLRPHMLPKFLAVICVLSPRMTTGHGKSKVTNYPGTARPWQFDLRPGTKFINLKH